MSLLGTLQRAKEAPQLQDAIPMLQHKQGPPLNHYATDLCGQ